MLKFSVNAHVALCLIGMVGGGFVFGFFVGEITERARIKHPPTRWTESKVENKKRDLEGSSTEWPPKSMSPQNLLITSDQHVIIAWGCYFQAKLPLGIEGVTDNTCAECYCIMGACFSIMFLDQEIKGCLEVSATLPCEAWFCNFCHNFGGIFVIDFYWSQFHPSSIKKSQIKILSPWVGCLEKFSGVPCFFLK